MNATLPCHATRPTSPSAATQFTIQLDGEPCVVRATQVWTIEEVLEFAQQFDEAGAGPHPQDMSEAHLVADVLDSRMIAPPRPRRRRQRPLSSRAMFYSSARG
jgi:hypothetical protein